MQGFFITYGLFAGIEYHTFILYTGNVGLVFIGEGITCAFFRHLLVYTSTFISGIWW